VGLVVIELISAHPSRAVEKRAGSQRSLVSGRKMPGFRRDLSIIPINWAQV
jgi:hypothetical protein